MNGIADFTGRNIVVVGGSSGIGRQTAIRLSELGAKVSIVARREDKLKEVCCCLQGDHNRYYVADINELDEIDSLLSTICSEQGNLDGLVYSAGISMSLPLRMFKPEKLKQIFNINFFAFVECVRQATRKGRFNEGMRIVGVSSIASMVGDKAHLGYSASKAAMDAAVRCIAKEVAEKGICINTIAPAMTDTDMHESFLEKYGENSDTYKDLMKRQYLGIAKVAEIADAIAFLLSPAASFITGVTLPVDGGLTTT